MWINKGDKVVCVTDYFNSLTKGKTYTTTFGDVPGLRFSNELISVINDDGEDRTYEKSHFEKA
jgi:hypothetical protein